MENKRTRDNCKKMLQNIMEHVVYNLKIFQANDIAKIIALSGLYVRSVHVKHANPARIHSMVAEFFRA